MKVIVVNSWVHKATGMVFELLFSSHNGLTQRVCQNLSQDASLLSVIYIDNAHSVWFNNNNINTFNNIAQLLLSKERSLSLMNRLYQP